MGSAHLQDIQHIEDEDTNVRDFEDGGRNVNSDPFDLDRLIWNEEQPHSCLKENMLSDQNNSIKDIESSNGGHVQLNKSLSSSSEYITSVVADQSTLNIPKGSKKGSKKSKKKASDIKWASFIAGISSPDHNKSVSDCSSIQLNTNSKNKPVPTAVEIEAEETMHIGELLGFNLSGFKDQIQEIIMVEGGVNPSE